jgi:hypothetical protein
MLQNFVMELLTGNAMILLISLRQQPVRQLAV